MEKACHPHDPRRLIDVAEYRHTFGRPRIDTRGQRLQDDRERANCPACRQNLNDVGGTTPGTFATFSHFRNSAYCPLKQIHAGPYLTLPDIRPEPEIAARLRSAFRAHWRWHWAEINRLATWLSIEEFLTLLTDADQRDLWSYCRLRELDIPYVLVTRADFEPTTKKDRSPARPTWRRFYYSSAVRTFDDLWIQPPADVRLLRATFRPNGTRGARPRQEHLIAAEEKERYDFLAVPEPVLNKFVVAKVEAWFVAHRWPEAAHVV